MSTTAPSARVRSRRALLTGRAPGPAAGEAVVAIDGNCLLARGIVCQACTDSCEPRALRYRMQRGGAGRIEIDTDACTACGECLATCPANAMTLTPVPAGPPA